MQNSGLKNPIFEKFRGGEIKVLSTRNVPGLETVPGRDGRTDEQTDGQTDRITIANTRYMLALARKNQTV